MTLVNGSTFLGDKIFSAFEVVEYSGLPAPS
jgi:hypothetical protein